MTGNAQEAWLLDGLGQHLGTWDILGQQVFFARQFDASGAGYFNDYTAQFTSTVGGSVPATLALTLGAPASFGPFTPGLGKDYLATTTATVISTAGDATLTVADPDGSANSGHLVNGAFSLPTALQASGSTSGTYSALPATLKTYAGPVSNDAATVSFKQTISDKDALRTGTYAKTLTFTLSTNTP